MLWRNGGTSEVKYLADSPILSAATLWTSALGNSIKINGMNKIFRIIIMIIFLPFIMLGNGFLILLKLMDIAEEEYRKFFIN